MFIVVLINDIAKDLTKVTQVNSFWFKRVFHMKEFIWDKGGSLTESEFQNFDPEIVA